MKTAKLNSKVLGSIFAFILLASLLAVSTPVYSSSTPGFEREYGTPPFNVKQWMFTLSGPLSNYLLNHTFEPKPLLSPQDLSLTLKPSLAGAQVLAQPMERNITFTSNIRVTKDIYFYENEPSIAANPLNPRNLVTATHQYTLEGVFVATYTSNDGGDSWEGPTLLPLARPGDFLASDPGAASTPDGVFYVSYLSLGFRVIVVSGSPKYVLGSDIVVARSTDGGRSWVTTIASTPESMMFEIPWYYSIWYLLLDKPYIAAGPPNTVIVSYTEFIIGYNYLERKEFVNTTIKAVVSRDGGLTWSEPLKISPTVGGLNEEFRVVQGSYPTVGPDGTVYVTYYDSGLDGWLEGSAFIVFSKLSPGSLNFTEPNVIAIIPYEVNYYSPYLGFRWWSLMFPVPSASNNNIYVVYGGALEPGGMPKVFMVKSKDGGLTWGQPKLVSPEGGAQFFPWVTTSLDGVVHIVWGDTRNDPSNFAYDIYHTASMDGGETFSAPARVTDYTSNPIFGIRGFIGDYFNAVATKDNVHIVWTDTRRGLARIGGFTWIGVDQSIFTAKIGPRPKPQLDIDPLTMEAGQAWVITIRGSNMPREAPLLIGFDGVSLGILAFTDSMGRVEVKLLTPAAREGLVKVTLHDYTTLNIVGEGALKVANTAFATLKATVENNSAKVITTIDKLGLKVNESVKALSDEIAVFKREITGKVEVVTSTVYEVKGGLIRFKEDFETAAKALGTTLEGVQTSLKNVGVTVNSINAAIPDLARKGDIDSAKSSLEEAIGEAKNVAASSSRNWGVANALLTVIVLAVLAYQVYTARKS